MAAVVGNVLAGDLSEENGMDNSRMRVYMVQYNMEELDRGAYYKVDNLVQEVKILVLGKMMGNVTMVDGLEDSFLGQLGEGHVVQEEEDILEERFPFLNLRSRDVAHEVLGTLCSCSMSAEIGGTPATATVIGGEYSQWRWTMLYGQVLGWKIEIFSSY